jgi:acetyl-CoA C-acetyltransferase
VAREVVVAGLCRTPIGTFGGTLKDAKTVELGRIVMEESIKSSCVKP